MENVDLLELPAPQMFSVIYSLIVEESFNPMEESRADGRKRVDEWLAENASVVEKGVARSVDPDTWGLLPEHQSGLEMAMSMAGAATDGDGAL